jgi:hypothetical protein
MSRRRRGRIQKALVADLVPADGARAPAEGSAVIVAEAAADD